MCHPTAGKYLHLAESHTLTYELCSESSEEMEEHAF